MDTENTTSHWLDRPISNYLPKLNLETILTVIIILMAVLSRFVDVDKRVMAHDEINHVVPAHTYYSQGSYRYDPVTHGPLQFHLLAFSYYLFGDDDFTSRIPAAAISVAAVLIVLYGYRRYLGRVGALIAGLLFTISPYMMYYGRYTRNEAFTQLWGVLTLLVVLQYLEKGERKSLFLLTIVMALHFTDKATSFIYTAELLIFLLIWFIRSVTRLNWRDESKRSLFTLFMIGVILFIAAALGLAIINAGTTPTATANLPLAPEVSPETVSPRAWTPVFSLMVGAMACALLCGVMAIIFLVEGLGWKVIRAQRSFDLMILLGTFVLPQLAAIPVSLVGWDPLDYTPLGSLRTGGFVILLVILTAAIGIWWRWRLWLTLTAIFWAIFGVFYTSFLTWGNGFFTGLVGALGYWMSQQGVTRGSQPIYYFLFLQIPVYEYLAAMGTLLAVYFGVRYRKFITWAGFAPAKQPKQDRLPEVKPAIADDEVSVRLVQEEPGEVQLVDKVPVLGLLAYWSLMSLVAFSLAGEKMPWLTVNIALPMLLASGWGLGFLVDSTPWKRLQENKGWVALLLFPILLASLSAVLGSLLGTIPPFSGKTLEELNSTSQFLLGLIGFGLSSFGVIKILWNWSYASILRLVTATIFVLMGILTARTAYRASFINYDYATEFLVYAHAAPGPKQVFEEIEDLSFRLTGGKDLVVAYSNDALYPYWWYLRDYPKKIFYADKPTRSLQDAHVVIAGDDTRADVDRLLKDNFVVFKYKRLWWPMQDYWDMFKARDMIKNPGFSLERVWETIVEPERRAAIWDIWYNRDYTRYAKINNRDTLTVENWEPSANIWVYIRKDIVSQVWNYGAAPGAGPVTPTDPYKELMLDLAADQIIGSPGIEPGQLLSPRSIAFAPDGTLYVADQGNHRIQHFAADGTLLKTWGTFADILEGEAPGGTFNQPWGVAVAPDGTVYVADTWNHRVQKFTADGEFIKMWGYWGQADTEFGLYGPRGIAVDKDGNVYITDTGNKRVVIFTPDGQAITSFGTEGFDEGEFDEPVGIAVSPDGLVYIADTWNRRIQVMAPTGAGSRYSPLRSWDVNGWFGQSLENKPFLTLDRDGNVLVTDPENIRVLVFSPMGKFLRGWMVVSPVSGVVGLTSGVAVDADGHVWVTDAAEGVILRYTLPPIEQPAAPAQPSPTELEP